VTPARPDALHNLPGIAVENPEQPAGLKIVTPGPQ